MTAIEAPNRESVIAIIAAHANRPPDSVPELIDSLGVAWLVYEAERRFGIFLELDDEMLAQLSTVDGAVEVLQAAWRQGAHPGG
jgi:acyl carrier protein